MHCPLLWKFCMEVTSYFVKQYCRRISWKVSEVMIYFMGLRWKGQLSTEDYLPWWFLVLANSLPGALRDLVLLQQICRGRRDAPVVEQGSLRLCRAAEMSPALWCMYIQPLLSHLLRCIEWQDPYCPFALCVWGGSFPACISLCSAVTFRATWDSLRTAVLPYPYYKGQELD